MDTSITTPPEQPSGLLDADLLKRAMEEVDREYTVRGSTNPQQPPQPSRNILEQGIDAWKSVGVGMVKAGIETKDFVFGEPEEDEKSEARRYVERRSKELSEASPFNALAMGISQFATGLLGAGKLMAPVKAVQKLKTAGQAGRTAYEVGKGAMVGAVVIDPHEERLSNLIQSFPALQNPVTDYLSADPEDSAAEGRFKNALEGIGLDLAITGILGSSIRAYRFLKEGEPEKAAEEIAKLEKERIRVKAPSRPVAATETHTAPPASSGASIPDDAAEATSAAPRVETGQAGPLQVPAPENAARAISPSGETNQAGGTNPDLPSPVQETPPSVAPRSPAMMEVSPEDVSKILLATDTDLKAIAKFGSREAAAEAGQMTSRSASRLPWQKLQAPDGLSAFMDNATTILKAQMDAAKGGDILRNADVSAKVRAMADFWGEDPASLMGELVRAGEEASTMTARMEAAYLISNRMLDETYETAFKVRNGMLDEWGGDAAKAGEELKARLEAATTLLASGQSIRSNVGRTMGRLRGQFHLKPEDLQAVKEMDPAQLADLIYSTKGDPKKLAQVTNPTFLRRVLNEATFSLTNSMLWLYPTHIVNIASNLYMLAGRPTEKLLGSLALGPKAGGDILRQRAIREYAATVAALGDAWEAGVEAFMRGDSLLSPHNTEFFQGAVTQRPLQWEPITTAADLAENAWKAFNYRNVVGLPTRTLGAVDEFFKTLRYRAYVQAQAATEANARGLSGEDFKRYVSGQMERAIDPATGRALDQRALQEAQATTFQSELLSGTAGATIQQARNRHPVLTFVLPFVKTPINVLRYGWKMTPGLNLLQGEYLAAIRGRSGAEAQAHAIGQMTLGASFMGLAATLTLNGKITGGGPKDPKLQQELRATGWQPYSFVIEGEDGSKRYVPLGRFDPVAMPFTMVADLVEAMRLSPESKDAEIGMGAALLSIATSFSDRTFLQNVHQALEAVSDETGSMGERWLANVAGNTIPLSSALRGANPDPYLRDARGFIDTMLKNMPGYSETLPPTRDAYGEPVWRRIGLTTEGEADEVEAEHNRIMLETGKSLGKPHPKLGGADLRDITLRTGQNAYDRLQELSGQLPTGPSLKQRLAEIIRADWYQELPDGDSDVKGTRINALMRQVKAYREAAKGVLLMENPELQELTYQRQKDAFIARERNKAAREPGARELLGALRGETTR
ncbi:hypothetical protein M8R20_06745 [Pseudomonas sp. R2.Fl]|nr:hypothetical protein [Pseudomonas sp. R2.Fl]